MFSAFLTIPKSAATGYALSIDNRLMACRFSLLKLCRAGLQLGEGIADNIFTLHYRLVMNGLCNEQFSLLFDEALLIQIMSDYFPFAPCGR